MTKRRQPFPDVPELVTRLPGSSRLRSDLTAQDVLTACNAMLNGIQDLHNTLLMPANRVESLKVLAQASIVQSMTK